SALIPLSVKAIAASVLPALDAARRLAAAPRRLSTSFFREPVMTPIMKPSLKLLLIAVALLAHPLSVEAHAELDGPSRLRGAQFHHLKPSCALFHRADRA